MEKASKSKLPCYLYDYITGRWVSFKSLIIYLAGSSETFFHYENPSTTSKAQILKKISYEYVVCYSKLVPSALTKPRDSTVGPSTFHSSSLYEEGEQPEPATENLNIKSMIVLEDLNLRYDSDIKQDQYIVLGFGVKNSTYEEDNIELKFIRDIIADMHVKLKYSQGGLTYQISQRIQAILYKTLKYSLCYISSLCNIPSGISVEEKLRTLQKMYYDPAFQDYLDVIMSDSEFAKEVTSLAYKTLASVGLFPAYVELNTMNELGIWLKIKNILTNPVNAPYGSRHHASFSLGNFRYSFVFEPRNKEKQRVTIASEIKRGFSLKNHAYKYFRVKFFDYFPMDWWISAIAERALKLLRLYFMNLVSLSPNSFDESQTTLKSFLWFLVDEQEEQHGKESISKKIARDFYERYKTELDDNYNDRLFKKITRLISDAEVRGYKNLSNNCQTIVSEIISVFGARLQRFVEPLFDLSKIPYMDDISKEDLLKDFLRFGSHFNSKFTHVAPFPLTYRLSYFDTFSDKDSCELFYPKKFENMHKHVKEYLARPDVRQFLAKLEDELTLYARISIGAIQNQSHKKEEKDMYPDIKFNSGPLYSVVSCLLSVIYNELFSMRREIKIARYCEERLMNHQNEETASLSQSVKSNSGKPKDLKKWKTMAEKLPSLFDKKYQLLDVYKELCFYYYNTARLGLRIKLSDKVSVLGFLIIKKPNYKPEVKENKEVKKVDEVKKEKKEEEINLSVKNEVA